MVITPAMLELAAEVPEAADLAARGWRVLVDKQHLAERFTNHLDAHRKVSAPAGPTEDEITDAVARFWHGCIWTARKLRRGELWIATVSVNCGLHQLLLQVLEWEAQTRPSGASDAWCRGRFLERWADPNAVRRLPTTFASYERHALARALDQLAGLYSDLISEVAARIGASPPRDIESYGAEMVKSILSS